MCEKKLVDDHSNKTAVYGPTTLTQILDGKHMKRAFEAHMVLYLSLTTLFSENLLKSQDWRNSYHTTIEKAKAEVNSSSDNLVDVNSEQGIGCWWRFYFSSATK